MMPQPIFSGGAGFISWMWQAKIERNIRDACCTHHVDLPRLGKLADHTRLKLRGSTSVSYLSKYIAIVLRAVVHICI